MSITWADVTAVAPELSAVSSGAQTAILAYVNVQMNANVWGTKLSLGQTYLAAHFGATTLRGGSFGPSGPITAESVGDVSRSYAAPMPSASDPSLGSTPYGLLYRWLLRTLVERVGMCP